MKRWVSPFLLVAVSSLLGASYSRAEEKSVSPYIDRLKGGLPEVPFVEGESSSYTETLKNKLPPPKTSGSYIQKLKETDQDKRAGETASEVSYTEQERLKLEAKDEAKNPQSAIADFHAGKSELHAKMVGDIHHAMGIKVGAAMTREIVGDSTFVARPYSQVYGDGWVPDVSLHYEFQPFHSEWFGNIGLFSDLGITRVGGTGSFKGFTNFTSGGVTFTSPKTKYQFFTVPMMVGLNYRFNLLRVLRPYVMAAPTLIGYWETRNDNKDAYKGYSKGMYFAGGVSVLMDWFSASSAWNYYADYGVKHYYLTVEYSKLTSLQSELEIGSSGITVGLLFEY